MIGVRLLVITVLTLLTISQTKSQPPLPIETSISGEACFLTEGLKWQSSKVGYRVDVSMAAWDDAVAAAASSWNDVGAGFTLEKDQRSPFLVKFSDRVEGNLAGKTIFRAIDKELVFVQTLLNAKLHWTSSETGGNAYDVQNVVTHEFGHWLQLLNVPVKVRVVSLDNFRTRGEDWSACEDVTMFPISYPGEIKKRTLEPGDVSGMKSLYQ